MKRFNLLYTALLGILLVTPLVLRRWSEPYPAILLPFGARKAKLAPDHIDVTRIQIEARNRETGAWSKVPARQFIEPIPVQYFPGLSRIGFGLKPVQERTAKIARGLKITTTPRVTDAEVEEAKEWLRRKLAENGCDDSEFRIVQQALTLDRSSGAEITSQDTHVQTLRLR